MRALVTGGAGFIGTNLIKRLLKEGHKVVSIDNYSTGKKENEQDGCLYYDYELSYSYVRDDGDSYDIIFHLAALPRIQPSFEDPLATFNANVLSISHILEYARKDNIPVVYAGSSSIHGDKYANPYTFTKWLGEEVCKMYSKVFKLPVTICRFYNVYGSHHLTEGVYCTVLGIFENQYKNGKPLTITWDGEQRRDFTHVDDIVDGLIRAANHGGYYYTFAEYELGRGKNYSVNEIADAFGDYPREYIPKRDGEMRETLCTDKKAKKEMGWKPYSIDIIDYIKKYILVSEMVK